MSAVSGDSAPSDDVTVYDGPVYTPGLSPQFHGDAHEAAERAWDDGLDPTKVEAFSCIVRKAHVPDLVEVVEEAWFEEYDDPDDPRVSKPVAEALRAAQALAEADAPDVWESTRVTVVLPAAVCPECGVASNEPWDEMRADCKFCDRPSEADAAALSASSERLPGVGP